MNHDGAKAATEAADENAKSALAVTVPAATKDEGQSEAEVGDAGAAGVGSAARMLALAQKLHDEYVAEGQNTREKLISEGQSRHDALIAEAQQKRAEVLQELGSERSRLQKEIEELRTCERDHRARQKSYLEGQLIELGQTGTDETG
jgi:polyhydroxyalkanoate synthesis regulator phasin